MSVYDDYRNKRWEGYFAPLFRMKHLRPYIPVPLGGHPAARKRARLGNIGLNRRAQQGYGATVNTLIYDFDVERKVKQILLLMQEVEQRNTAGYYQDENNPHPIHTLEEYNIQTTGQGSRQQFFFGLFDYDVEELDNGRYVINHFDGVVE
jgi:hypothetical protein